MKIFVKNLTFDTIIGILDFERTQKQSVTFNVEITYSGEYVNYAIVRELLLEHTDKEQFLLLEDALLFFSKLLKNRFPQIGEIKMALQKNTIFDDCLVGVEEEYKFLN